MDFTWLAILASLAMGIGTALVFVFAVKGNHFQNVEDAKYQVFWSELEEPVDGSEREGDDGGRAERADCGREQRSHN
jgi:hypothetical protein